MKEHQYHKLRTTLRDIKFGRCNQLQAFEYHCIVETLLDELLSAGLERPNMKVLHNECLRLVSRSQKVVAIKLYRDSVGCDLRTAKDAVEALVLTLQTVSGTPHKRKSKKQISKRRIKMRLRHRPAPKKKKSKKQTVR